MKWLLEKLLGKEKPREFAAHNLYENLVLKREQRNRKIGEFQAAQQEVIAAEKEVRRWEESRRLRS